MEQTKNYKLNKPGQDDFYNVEDFNQNADILDQALKELADGGSDQYVSKTGDTMTGRLIITDGVYEDIRGLNIYDVTEVGNEKTIISAIGPGVKAKPLVLGGSEIMASGGTFTNLPDPEKATDAANKKYVDDNAGGKRTCRFVVGTSTAGWTKKDCDYLCDGTDDQVEIQAAINALPSTGGEVVVLDGIYSITATINVNKNNVTLRGNGDATMLKRMWNAITSSIVNVTGNTCCIKNFHIYGNSNSVGKDNILSGINIIGNNNIITGNLFNYNDYGIRTRGVNTIIIQNRFNYNNDDAIYLSDSSRNIIIGNVCIGNNAGIYLFNNITNNNITGNVFNNNIRYGIYLHNSSNNTINGNMCIDNSYGINLSNINTNNNITGNTVIRGTGLSSDYTSTQYTIRLEGTYNKYNLIANNNIMGKNYVSGGGTSNTFVNNKYN